MVLADKIIVITVAIIVYWAIIFGKNIKKSVFTMFFAMLLFLFKAVQGLTLENIGEIVDFNTIGLLLGMMIVVDVLKNSGFFTMAAVGAIKAGKGNFWIVLFALMIVIALLSAFLDNLITLLLVAPIIFLLADTLGLDPISLMLFTIFIDNIGGMSTVIGSPLNIALSSIAKLDFTYFLEKMAPIFIISFGITFLLFKLTFKYDKEKVKKKIKYLMEMDLKKTIKDKRLMVSGLIVFTGVIIGFVSHGKTGVELSIIAQLGGFMLMLILGKDFESMGTAIDWDTLFFYIGLYVISYSLEEIGLTSLMASFFEPLIKSPILLNISILLFGAAVIPFLSAVPGTLIIAPMLSILIAKGAPTSIWFSYAIGANLGTNLTPLGAVQNIVGLTLLEKQIKKPVTFGEFMKKAAPYVSLTILFGLAYSIFLTIFMR